MRLYIVNVDGVLYPIRSETRNLAVLQAIEQSVNDTNNVPSETPFCVGCYTNTGRFVKLIK